MPDRPRTAPRRRGQAANPQTAYAYRIDADGIPVMLRRRGARSRRGTQGDPRRCRAVTGSTSSTSSSGEGLIATSTDLDEPRHLDAGAVDPLRWV